MRQHHTLVAGIRRLTLEGSSGFVGATTVNVVGSSFVRAFHALSSSAARNLISLDSQRDAVVVSSDVEGAAASFLQSTLTNDVVATMVDSPRPSNGRLLYAHMLNSKGRYTADVFVYGLGKGEESGGGDDRGNDRGDRVKSTGARDVLVIDVAKESKEQLMKVLRMYSMRSAVRIEDGGDEFVVCASLNGGMEGGRFAAFCEDPRAKGALGYRGLVRRASQHGFLETLAGDEEAVRASYTKLRLSLGLAEGPREIPVGSVALEYNLDGMNGISFNKGCYIGQELMARTHYQGQIRKRLVPFRIEESAADNGVGRAVYDEEIIGDDGKSVGVVRADSVDGYGIGLMRLAKVFGKEGRGGRRLRLAQSGLRIEAYAPAWWPKEWTVGY